MQGGMERGRVKGKVDKVTSGRAPRDSVGTGPDCTVP